MLEFWTSLLQDSLVNRLAADDEDSIQNGFNDDSEDVEYVESTPLLSSIKPEFPGHSGLVGLPKGYFAFAVEPGFLHGNFAVLLGNPFDL